MSSFSQRNMFDVLDVEDGPEHEEIVEEFVHRAYAGDTLTHRIPEEPDSTVVDPAPLSKSAKKRAARAARLAAEALEKRTVSPAANGKSSNNDTALPQKTTSGTEPQTESNSRATPAAGTTNAKGASGDNATKSASKPVPVAGHGEKTVSTAPAMVDAQTIPAKQSSSPPTSSFKPSLPADLPTRAIEELPTNRKRKTPVDFSPSGPGSALTPASPSKNSVKFEDGVLPGEGAEGERTITRSEKNELQVAVVAPKKQNFVERTVWTFIMIFGFIGV